jgi:2-polyprenyl-3-methyl-5-hydroxy-6-metoxy-1,4-benzoquinol methylase
MANECLSTSSNCKSKDFIDFGLFHVANFPTNQKKFNKYIKKNNFIKKKRLKLRECSKCKYLKLENKLNSKILDNIYEKFYKYPSAMLNQIVPTRDNVFLDKLFKNIDFKRVKNVLEIGCYDGYILHKIKKKFPKINVSGCEPSEGANIARKFNLNVKKKFFNEKTFKYKKFDLVILRHTLEHIDNIKKILTDIKLSMNENSYLAIEVPNVNFYLQKGLLEVFSFQHIHYFSSKSFEVISKNHNFSIFKNFETPENLIIFLKNKVGVKKKKINFNKLYSDTFSSKIKKNALKIKKIISKYNSNEIVIWGAGGFAIAAACLYKIPINTETLIFDKDSAKHGLTLLDTSSKILKINKNLLKNRKLIIITSYYSSQIFKEIKKLHKGINVMQIFPKIKLIKI